MQNIKKRGILSLLLTMFMISGIAAGLFALSKKAYAAEDYHTWRQHDERWGSVSMGSSTIARSGCLITSLSIMAMHSDSLDDSALKNLKISSVDEFNPGVLANAYTERRGFSYGGGIASWGTLGQIIPSITFLRDSYLKGTTKSEIAAEIKAMMRPGLSMAERESEIDQLLKLGCYGPEPKKTALNKHLTGDKLLAQREKLLANWDNLRSRMQKRLIPYQEMYRKLAAANCPVTPAAIGLTPEQFRHGIRTAQLIRNRYTVLDLLYELGVLDNAIESLDVMIR